MLPRKEMISGGKPIVNWLVCGCIHVEKTAIYGKEMKASTYKDGPGSCVLILEENLVQIGFFITEKLFLVKFDVDLHFQGQLMWRFCCLPQLHNFGESFVEIGRIRAEI